MLRLKRPLPLETSTLNQSKNMKMKRRTADPPAIFSPVLSLSIFLLLGVWGGSVDPKRASGVDFDADGRVSYSTARWCAACSVFASSIAIVIGPTPPGTGVIA